jgi:hypothetical protein
MTCSRATPARRAMSNDGWSGSLHDGESLQLARCQQTVKLPVARDVSRSFIFSAE